MNKTFKLAISAVLGAAMVTPAFAQRDNFPDIKDTHWAFEAVNRLKKEGIITGYPDGTFKGKQFITRYELATLLYAIYTNLKNENDALSSKVSALEAKVNSMGSGSSSNSNSNNATSGTDLTSLRDALASAQRELAAMRAWGGEITTLKKMADSYQKELTALGVDVEAMKKDLSDLNKRVTDLENKKTSLKISGDANFFVTAINRGSRGNAPINQDGRSQGSNANAAGLDTLRVNHELGLKLESENVKGDLVASSFFGNPLGQLNQSSANGQFLRGFNEGPTNLYLNRLYVTNDDSLAGLNFAYKIGRQGMKISPFVMQRLDNNSFYTNEREDNGEFLVDGVNAALKFGANTDFHIFLGRTSTQTGTDGTILQPITIGAEQLLGANLLPVTRVQGATLGFNLGENGKLQGAYVNYDGDGLNGAGANRLDVWGADLSYKLGGNISLMGGYGKSTWKKGSGSIADTDNARTNASVKYDAGSLGLMVDWQRVEQNYIAPGDWGRIGIYRNLTNLTTLNAGATFKLNDKFDIFGGVQRSEAINGAGKVDGFRAGFNYKLNQAWDLMTSYEDTEFKNGLGFNGANNQRFKFTTFGFGYNMGANTLFKLYYQLTDATNINGPGGPNNAANPNGGFIAAQYSIKF